MKRPIIRIIAYLIFTITVLVELTAFTELPYYWFLKKSIPYSYVKKVQETKSERYQLYKMPQSVRENFLLISLKSTNSEIELAEFIHEKGVIKSFLANKKWERFLRNHYKDLLKLKDKRIIVVSQPDSLKAIIEDTPSVFVYYKIPFFYTIPSWKPGLYFYSDELFEAIDIYKNVLFVYFDMGEYWQRKSVNLFELSLTESPIISYKPYLYLYLNGKFIDWFSEYPDSNETENVVIQLIGKATSSSPTERAARR